MEQVNSNSRVLPRRIRWLALATGCVSGAVLASFSWPLVFAVFPLILCAAVQRVLPRAGRWFISIVAALVSVTVVPAGVVSWWEIVTVEGSPPHDMVGIAVFVSWMLAPLLLIWCDTELILEAVRVRGRLRTR